MERLKSLGTSLESVFRNSYQVDGGFILANDSFLIKCSVEEPVQSSSQTFYKSIGTTISFESVPKLDSFSPSRAIRAMITEKEEERVLEIWQENRLYSAKKLNEIHGEVITSACFGKMAWTSDEKYLVYIAEKKSPKKGNFWSSEEEIGTQNLYIENYGETISNAKNPVLVIYNIDTEDIECVENQAAAQPIFKPDSYTLVFVSNKAYPYKLGLSLMMNRETSLKSYNIITKEIAELKLMDGLVGGHYPKFSPDGKYMTYFGVPEGTYSHFLCMPLIIYEWDLSLQKTLVDVVQQPNEVFNGVYGYHDTLQNSNWLDNTQFVFSTYHGFTDKLIRVSIDGQLSEIPTSLEHSRHIIILDILQGKILYSESNFKTLPKVFVTDQSYQSKLLIDNTIECEDGVIKELKNESKFELIKNPATNVESLLFYTDPSNPLILLLHGGPHSTTRTAYSPFILFKLSQNFNFLFPNYRGSIGYGQDFLSSLLGNIGTMDVGDCIEALQLSKQFINPKSVISMGGSHGGFLSGHIASSGCVDASVVLNGVLDIDLMRYTTDITDWSYAEVLNSGYTCPTGKDERFYQASPIAKAKDISVPVFIAAGGNDLRVHPCQSLAFYKVLKGLQKDVIMFWYENDGHALSIKPSAYDLEVNVVGWMLDKINRSHN